jgi:hypothetical protein
MRGSKRRGAGLRAAFAQKLRRVTRAPQGMRESG